MKEKKVIHPIYGLLSLVTVLVLMIFIAAPLQMHFGMLGLAITELMILAVAVIFTIIFKGDFKEIFPFHVPKFRQIFGTTFLWLGYWLITILAGIIINYLFPTQMNEIGGGMQNLFTSVPIIVQFLIVAVMPAICEEALHRGFILSTSYRLKSKWVIILYMGALFGVFHMDPLRFLPTAILGVGLTYVMMESGNILLPMLFHFINNSISVLSSNLTASIDTHIAMTISIEVVASYMIIATLAPIFILVGSRLLRKKEAKRSRKEIIATVLISVAFLTAGTSLSVASVLNGFGTVKNIKYASRTPVINCSVDNKINSDSLPTEIPFTITKKDTYLIEFGVESKRGLTDIRIKDSEGNDKYQSSCLNCTVGNEMILEPGEYKFIFTFHLDDIEEYYKENGLKFNEEDIKIFGLEGDLSEYSPMKIWVNIQ